MLPVRLWSQPARILRDGRHHCHALQNNVYGLFIMDQATFMRRLRSITYTFTITLSHGSLVLRRYRVLIHVLATSSRLMRSSPGRMCSATSPRARSSAVSEKPRRACRRANGSHVLD